MTTPATHNKWETMKRQSCELWDAYSRAGAAGFASTAKAKKAQYTANARKMKAFAKRNGLISDYNRFFSI
jgi:hypothetical protein